MSHTEVDPGVAVVETRIADGKAGVIVGTEVALAVDAGIDESEGAAVRAAAASYGRARVELVYTHGHADHALGGTAFAGCTIRARPEVGEYMGTHVREWAERAGVSSEAFGERLGWPTMAVIDHATLDLGGRVVRLLDTPGHAPGAICVHDPDAGVLFGGDTIVTAIPPAFADGDSSQLERTLRQLAELGSRLLIPGHGDVVRGRAAVRDAIIWSADYLARCREHIDRHLHDPLERIIETAPYDDYIGDHLPADRFRMRWRHEQTIRRMLEERTQGSN